MPRLPVDGDKETIALSPYCFVVDGNVVDLPAIRIDTAPRSGPLSPSGNDGLDLDLLSGVQTAEDDGVSINPRVGACVSLWAQPASPVRP
jgi:hypothetical protein